MDETNTMLPLPPFSKCGTHNFDKRNGALTFVSKSLSQIFSDTCQCVYSLSKSASPFNAHPSDRQSVDSVPHCSPKCRSVRIALVSVLKTFKRKDKSSTNPYIINQLLPVLVDTHMTRRSRRVYTVRFQRCNRLVDVLALSTADNHLGAVLAQSTGDC